MYKHGQFLTMENYHILKDKMENLDLLMFRGDDAISDTIAEIQSKDRNILEKCPVADQFTHAGIIVYSKLLPGYDLEPDRLYILESTYSYDIEGMDNGPPDCITGEKFFGVQLRDLERLCKSYLHNSKTKIAWFPLKYRPVIYDFEGIFRKYHKTPFLSQQIVQMTPCRSPGLINQSGRSDEVRGDKRSLFSSFVPLTDVSRCNHIVDFTQITPDVMMMAKYIINATLLQTVLQSSFSCVNLVTSVYKGIGLISVDTPIVYPIELLNLTQSSILQPE